MSNRIVRVAVVNRSLSPVEAELIVHVEAERVTERTEVRGRLVGPECLYSTTVEVAYPLRPFPRPLPDAPLARRVVVPEPSLWDPISPFLYAGVVELWQDGAFADRAEIRHGVRSVRLQADGLFWNGKPLKVRAAEAAKLSAAELPALRARGINTLLIDWPAADLLAAGEQVGFAVLARIAAPVEAADSVALVGWLLPADWRANEAQWLAWMSGQRRFIGVECDDQPLPPGVHFLVGGPETPPTRPRLLRTAMGEIGAIVGGRGSGLAPAT